MAISRIPIKGLVHLVDIIERYDSDDGAGGIIPGTEKKIYSRLKARVTVMTNEDEQQLFGNASGEHWQVISKYAPDIERSMFLRLSSSSRTAVIPATTTYRILWVKHQIDHVGRFHHTSLAIELED